MEPGEKSPVSVLPSLTRRYVTRKKPNNDHLLLPLLSQEGFQESVDIRLVLKTSSLPWDRKRLSHNPGVTIDVISLLENTGVIGQWSGCIVRFIPLWNICEFYQLPFSITMYYEYLLFYPNERLYLTADELISRTDIATFLQSGTYPSLMIISRILCALPMRTVISLFVQLRVPRKIVRKIISYQIFTLFESREELYEFIHFCQRYGVHDHVILRTFYPTSPSFYQHVPRDVLVQLQREHPSMRYTQC